MKILLTGANGYIGKRLLPVLLDEGHQVVCCVRDKKRFSAERITHNENIEVIEVDFLAEINNTEIIKDIDAAYYLIHSMSSDVKNFNKLEETSAVNFVKFLDNTNAKQIIYLSGIDNQKKLSTHLNSRKRVEEVLRTGRIPVTTIKAGIIVGSGSASFEIIRDLVEKLPAMVTPKWLNTKTQPIAIRNVIQFLSGVLNNDYTLNKSFDIGGPEVLTYKKMLLQFAEVRGLKRIIFTLPVMTPKLSSYWLYFVTATSYKLAVNLVQSMKVEVIAQDNDLADKLKIELIPYKEAVKLAFDKIEQNNVLSSWKDSLVSSYYDNSLLEHIQVPENGCFKDSREVEINSHVEQVLDKIWSIGGEKGWYYGNWLWEIRGFLDKLWGGVGLRRGRTNPNDIHTGDTLDFWRVLIADKSKMRLLLYAEMKLPGEAWLEFRIKQMNNQFYLIQTATFRPKGLWGRVYWFSVSPFHFFIFDGMSRRIAGR